MLSRKKVVANERLKDTNTINFKLLGQFHQCDVIVESFLSVTIMVYDFLNSQSLGPVKRLLCQSHIDRPHGGVYKPEHKQQEKIRGVGGGTKRKKDMSTQQIG